MRRIGVHLRHRAARLQHAEPAAIAAVHSSTGQLTPWSLRIGSGGQADEVGLLPDNGNQCFSALPCLNPHQALLALLLLPSQVMELCSEPEWLL